jgi:predicted permease
VLSFVLLLTVVVGLLFGGAPAFAASRTSIAELIKVAGSRGGASRASGRRALVIGQVALATILLVGAGLMVRSFRALLQSDIGFAPAGMLKLELSGGDSTLSTTVRQDAMLARIAALPGMESAASYNCAPFESNCVLMPVAQVDQRAVDQNEYPPIEAHFVSRDFLRAMRTPLRLGRTFDSREAPGRVTGALVNETAARLLWRGESPIGRRVSTFRDSTAPAEIIGVVADVKYETIDGPVRPAIYFEMSQWGQRGGSVIVARTRDRDPASAMAEIRRVIMENDPTVAIHRVATGDEMVARAASSTRFIAALLSAFGVGAALLAALGVYGVLAYLVTQRRREFGIRMAIGAQASSVTALVVKQGLVLTMVGLVLGIAGAVVASGVLARFMFGVARADVLTYAVIVLVVGAAGVLAALIPARRATRVDPVMALRE